MERHSILKRSIVTVLVAATICFSVAGATFAADNGFLEPLRPYLTKAVAGFGRIPAERRPLLHKSADFISAQLAAGKEVKLLFMCTHNSRRSVFGQVWAQVAAKYYNTPNVATYSGGIEVAACNIRTVNALRRAGLSIVRSTEGNNPVYLAQYADNAAPLALSSKLYYEGGNPTDGFGAMMCCDDADAKCPLIKAALVRVPLHYQDPKIADGTPQETALYDERSLQIATEIFYVMSLVKGTGK